ncbi:NADH-quinone oxidoreductase subunit NuoN [Sulfurospirillum sp. 1612]|uniref:NADH-quinone oxidoreductase subunit NuoN n=1 Tax=Sulfurospirillum sp. 1612 TaxID=3094835 RepID=UPI002F92F225
MLEPISISLSSLNMDLLIPMAVLAFGALCIICIDIFTKNLTKSFYVAFTLLFLFLDFTALISIKGPDRGFFNVLLVDGISVLGQGIILITSALFILTVLSNKPFKEFKKAEYYAIFLFMIVGFQFMVASDNLILIFLGLETASLSLYALIAMHNRDKAFEAAIKYFTMGALASGFFAMASLIFYTLTGSIELSTISKVLVANSFSPGLLILAGVSFMLIALGFKLSIVPVHTWLPDVYEGSSAPLAGYIAVVPKIAGLVVAVRFFDIFLAHHIMWVENILILVSVITMTLANITALVQEDVKRMLAFSSIAHAGFVLTAIMVGNTQAYSAIFLYWILFMFTNMGAFTMLWIARHKRNLWDSRYQHPFVKFSGMAKVAPMMATIFGLFMFTLAGMPPFSVFWGKLYVLGTVVNSGHEGLAVIMVINSAIAVYYYMKLMVYMFLKEPITEDGNIYEANMTVSLKLIVGATIIFTITASLFVEPILNLITRLIGTSSI